MESSSGWQVLSMIRFGAAAVFAGGNREPTDAELEQLIDRTRTADDKGDGALRGGAQLDAASFDATAAPVQTKTLFGCDFTMPKSEKDIAEQWREAVQGKREKKARVKLVAAEGSGYGERRPPAPSPQPSAAASPGPRSAPRPVHPTPITALLSARLPSWLALR